MHAEEYDDSAEIYNGEIENQFLKQVWCFSIGIFDDLKADRPFKKISG